MNVRATSAMERFGTQVWSIILAVFLFQITRFIAGVKATKPCHVRSSHCLSSSQLTTQQELFTCPHRGHFLYPGDHFRYYRCRGADWLPCLCWCRYRDMCFDSRSGKCGFTFLLQNCSSPSTSSKIGTTTPTNEIQRKHQKLSGVISNNTSGAYDLTYRFKIHKSSNKHERVGQGQRSRPYNHAHQSVLTAQEVMLVSRQLAGKGRMKDVSVFPAWAVAAIVLCVVMVLVLMIIFMY